MCSGNAIELFYFFFFFFLLLHAYDYNHGLSPANIPNMVVNIEFLIVFSLWHSFFLFTLIRNLPSMSYTEISVWSYCCRLICIAYVHKKKSNFSLFSMLNFMYILTFLKFPDSLRFGFQANYTFLYNFFFIAFYLNHIAHTNHYSFRFVSTRFSWSIKLNIADQLCAYIKIFSEIPRIDYHKIYGHLW